MKNIIDTSRGRIPCKDSSNPILEISEIQQQAHDKRANIDRSEGSRRPSPSDDFSKPILKILYVFSGMGEKGCLREFLKNKAEEQGILHELEEVDIANGRHHDVRRRGVRQKLLKKVSKGGSSTLLSLRLHVRPFHVPGGQEGQVLPRCAPDDFSSDYLDCKLRILKRSRRPT